MQSPDLAIAVHLYLGGGDQAAVFAAHGFTSADVERALRVATMPLAEQEAAETRAGQVLVALSAPGITLERIEVRTLVMDEAPGERLERMEAAGWFDAVTHRPERVLPRAADADAYTRGRTAFFAALRAEQVAA